VTEAPVRVFAAGSLKAAFGEVADAMTRAGGPAVHFTFGAAGLLKDRIAGGEACDVFASANVEHPRALAGRGQRVFLFARNRLCALVREDLGASSANLIERMLDPAVRVGTSTPGADPSGDYALELFAKIDATEPGAGETLRRKATALTGGPANPKSRENGRSVYSAIMQDREADIFLTYVTNAYAVLRDMPGVTVLELPAEVGGAADYGLVVLSRRPDAGAVAQFILSQDGQDVLKRHGFEI
jgi:ABC-type molybdate transport system substrate-binding protein